MNEKHAGSMGSPALPQGPSADRKKAPAENPPSAKAGKKTPANVDGIRFEKLPASFLNILRETHWKEYGKLRLLQPSTDETAELANLAAVLEYVMKVSPGKCFARMRRGEIKADQVDLGYRNIRDAMGSLEDAIRSIADLAQMEVKAFTQPKQVKKKGLPPKSQAS